jgi:hypothetical protein
LAEPFVVEEEVVLMLLLRVEGVAGIEGSSVWNSGANSGPTLAPRELARVVTILKRLERCLWEESKCVVLESKQCTVNKQWKVKNSRRSVE